MSLKLENFPLAELLQKKLNHPVAVERNTVCGAYAERYLGCARNCDHFLYFLARPQFNPGSGTRRYSFGLAMTMNGHVYRGYNSAAGELHMALWPIPNKEAAYPVGLNLGQEDVREALLSLGKGLAYVIDLLDPEMLVLASDGQLLTNENLEILRQMVVDSLVVVPGRKLELTRSTLGLDGILYGAALMGLHRGLKIRLENPCLGD